MNCEEITSPLETNVAAVQPSPGTVSSARKAVPQECHDKSYLRALTPLFFWFTAYAATLWIAATASWYAAAVAAIANGVTMGILFVVGHDACHGSLSRSRTVNLLAGRLAFLPTLTPLSAWRLGHNKLHHGYTNLASHDYVWRPFSVEQFLEMPTWRRGLERFYRTSVIGFALYWIIEGWLCHLMVLSKTERKHLRDHTEWNMDRLLVAVFLTSLCLFCCAFASKAHPDASTTELVTRSVLMPIIAPQMVWSFVMGLLIYVHHTHPEIKWFATREEWSGFKGNVECTVHIELPGILNRIFLNIMEHSAHHVDPSIPMYHLPDAQEALETSFPDSVRVERLTVSYLRRLMATCQLYDFETQKWVPFSTAHVRP